MRLINLLLILVHLGRRVLGVTQILFGKKKYVTPAFQLVSEGRAQLELLSIRLSCEIYSAFLHVCRLLILFVEKELLSNLLGCVSKGRLHKLRLNITKCFRFELDLDSVWRHFPDHGIRLIALTSTIAAGKF